MQRRQQLPKLWPAHDGHHHVTDYEVETSLVDAGYLQCGLAVDRFEHSVPVLLQRLAKNFAHQVLVFHQQDRLVAAGSLSQRRLAKLLDVSLVAGEVDLERRSATDLGVDGDVATSLFDDSAHDGEPQSGALSDLLRREKRIVDLVAMLGGN